MQRIQDQTRNRKMQIMLKRKVMNLEFPYVVGRLRSRPVVHSEDAGSKEGEM